LTQDYNEENKSSWNKPRYNRQKEQINTKNPQGCAENCKTHRENYNYTRPPVECRYGNNCKKYNCKFAHTISMCRYLNACHNKRCKFRHPSGKIGKTSTRVTDRSQFWIPTDRYTEREGHRFQKNTSLRENWGEIQKLLWTLPREQPQSQQERQRSPFNSLLQALGSILDRGAY